MTTIKQLVWIHCFWTLKPFKVRERERKSWVSRRKANLTERHEMIKWSEINQEKRIGNTFVLVYFPFSSLSALCFQVTSSFCSNPFWFVWNEVEQSGKRREDEWIEQKEGTRDRTWWWCLFRGIVICLFHSLSLTLSLSHSLSLPLSLVISTILSSSFLLMIKTSNNPWDLFQIGIRFLFWIWKGSEIQFSSLWRVEIIMFSWNKDASKTINNN